MSYATYNTDSLFNSAAVAPVASGTGVATTAASGSGAQANELPYRSIQIAQDEFRNSCGDGAVGGTVNVPVYTKVLHRRPYIHETTETKVSYIQVPVNTNFERRDYRATVNRQCDRAAAPQPVQCAQPTLAPQVVYSQPQACAPQYTQPQYQFC